MQRSSEDPHPNPLPQAGEGVTLRARELRRGSTDAERLLWLKLRDRRLDGFKFRRQHPIGPYFADFACVEAMLVVELDGGQHFESENAAMDAKRTAVIEQHGYVVLRLDNWQMLREPEAVLQVIHQRLLRSRHPHPSPLPQAGEGARQGDTL